MWHVLTAMVRDLGGLPIHWHKIVLEGQDLRSLVLEVVQEIDLAVFMARDPVDHALNGLIHVDLEVQVWPSSTNCDVFGKAEEGFLRTMRRYALGAPSSGPSSPPPATPTVPPGSPPN